MRGVRPLSFDVSPMLAGIGRRAWMFALSAAAVASVSADVLISQRAADSFQRKVLQIAQYGKATLTGAKLTPVYENELNSYLRLVATPQLPPGVTEPVVTMVGEGRVASEALVDLDAVRKARKATGWLDPFAYLTGKLEVRANGVLATEQGQARLTFESASVAGVPVPKAVLQEIVAYYTRSPDFPAGVDLDDPFPLPVRIKEIHVNAGQAMVVQR
jgi:hypothetical protein